MSSRKQPTDLVNVDFWADRIAALIKLAEHHGMTVEITGGELVVSRQVSDAFIARTEVRWRPDSPAAEAPQQPDTETRTSWTHGPVALARAADWARKRQDATVDPAMCPRCHGDNSEAFELCARCAASPAVPVQPAAADRDRTVAYRSDGGRQLHCLRHVPPPAARHADFHPVTSEDLPDGGICTFPDCGVDVLIPQKPAAADTREETGA